MLRSKRNLFILFLTFVTVICGAFALLNFSSKPAMALQGSFVDHFRNQHGERVKLTENDDNSTDMELVITDTGASLSRAVYNQTVNIVDNHLYIKLTLKQLSLYGQFRISLLSTDDDYPGAGYGDGFSIWFWDETAWNYPAFSNLRCDCRAYGKNGLDQVISYNRIFGTCSQSDPKYYDPDNDIYPELYIDIWNFDANNYAFQVRRTANGDAIVSNTVPKTSLPAAFNAYNAYLIITPELDSRSESWEKNLKLNVDGVYNGNNALIKNFSFNSGLVEEISDANSEKTVSIVPMISFQKYYGQMSASPAFSLSSSDASVAYISGDNAVIPARAEGETTITATNGRLSRSFTLRVTGASSRIIDQSVNIGESLSFSARAYFIEEGTPTMTFTMGENSVTVNGEISNAAAKEWIFTFHGVAPQCMGDTIEMTLKAGNEVKDEKTSSIISYFDALFTSEGASTELKNLIADAIYYGASAQIYKGYKTDALVSDITAISAADLAAYATSTVPAKTVMNKTVKDEYIGAAIQITAAGVRFASENALYIKLNVGNTYTDAQGKSVTVRLYKLRVTADGVNLSFNNLGGGVYQAYSKSISALDFDTEHTFKVLYDGVEVVEFIYSVESYVYAKYGEGTDMATLALNLYRYGKSAEAYDSSQYRFKPRNINATTQNFTGSDLRYSDALWETPEYSYCEDLDFYVSTADSRGETTPDVKGIFFDSPVISEGRKTKVAAYIGFPQNASATNKVPAIVLVHGGLGTCVPQWAQYWVNQGFAAICIDTEGAEPISGITSYNTIHNEKNRYYNGAIDDAFTCGPTNVGFGDTDKPLEQRWMYHATSAAILAVSLISSFDCVDTQKVGMSGISWGSVITSIVIGYDDRVSFAMPIYGGVTMSQSSSGFETIYPNDEVKEIWDSTDALARTNCKVFYVTGTADYAFSQDIADRCAKAAQGFVAFKENFTHGQEYGTYEENLPYFAKYFCGLNSNYLEVLQSPTKTDGTMKLRTYGTVAINSITLCYTSDENTNYDTNWTSQSIAVVNGATEYNITIPDCKHAFVRIMYNGGLQVCSYMYNYNEKEIARMLSVEEVLANTSASDLTCSSYDLEKYMTDIKQSQIIYNETAMFLQNSDGTIDDKELLFPIAQVLEVRDNTLGILYEEGVDYEVVNGKLHYLSGSRIRVMAYDDYFVADRDAATEMAGAHFASVSREGRYYYYCESDYLISRQVSVTYIRTKSWQGPEADFDIVSLDKTTAKLENKENIKIAYYGDSVMTGCNSSDFLSISPNMPKLHELISAKVSDYYGYDGTTQVSYRNFAVGGWTALDGLNNPSGYTNLNDLIAYAPDLLIIGFGANDGAQGHEAGAYIYNMASIIQAVRDANPDMEVIVVSASYPNADAQRSDPGDMMDGHNMAGMCDTYVEHLRAYARDRDYASFADTTTLCKYILEKKDWWDITANNINHPNDFLVRIEAQLISSLICR